MKKAVSFHRDNVPHCALKAAEANIARYVYVRVY